MNLTSAASAVRVPPDYLLEIATRLGNIRVAPANGLFVDLQILTEQAVKLHQQGREDDAERLYLQVLAAAPADFTAAFMLGVICFRQARRDEAMQLFETALKTNPAAVGALIFQGLLLQADRRFNEALACFDRALAMDGNLVEALVNRGNVLCDMARFDEALPSYDKALAIRPAFELALYNRGNALRGLNRPVEALTSFDAALAVNPNYFDAWINRGSTLRDLKNSAEALSSFDKALSIQPSHTAALYNRGTALQDLKHFAEALDVFDRVLAIMPGFVAARNNRAVVLQNLQHLPEALAEFDRALALAPCSADMLSNRGNLLREMNRGDDALACIDKALSFNPAHAEALNNRGTILQGLKRFDEALSGFDSALALQPGDSQFLCNRALLLRDLSRPSEALAGFDAALAAQPDNIVAWCNRGLTLRDLHRLPEALASYDRALVFEPHFADALIGRGDTLREWGRFTEALESYDLALLIAPDNIAVLNNRGSALQKLKRLGEALASYDQAIEINPEFVDALYNRGNLLWPRLQRFDEAKRDLERVARIDPDYDYLPGDLLHLKMQACDWQDMERDFAVIHAGVAEGKQIVRPFVYQAISESPADLQAASVLYAGHRFPPQTPLARNRRGAREKIRIGYVSGDFREQATAFLATGLYECHDKSKFEIIAFDTGWSDRSPIRRRLEAAFDKFVDISNMPEKLAAEAIVAEDIDILVNLNGYFGVEPMGIFAYRPAPVQVNYLGFPATLGSSYIDYILADRIVIPEDEQRFYCEKVAYLPHTYQANDSRRPIADTMPGRDACGLPETGFVFCNFNHIYKLTPAMFAAWMNILRQAEGSVLWLLESNRIFSKHLRMEAERLGIAGARLVFAPPAEPSAHLARMRLADLFLDSLPYNAHTTASDALWAGLPLLTCRGKTFPGRVAASLLHAIDVPELVTAGLAEYQTLALQLAGSPALLQSIRQKLAENRLTTPLFDTNRFCRHIEAAYIAMWETFRRGMPPCGFSVEPIP